MLKNTFVHLSGVGAATERKFWQAGLATWEDFITAAKAPSMSKNRHNELSQVLTGHLQRVDDLSHWCELLPTSEHWRLFKRYRDRVAYLDIETTGMSPNQGAEISLIGIHFQDRFIPFVNGQNMDEVDDLMGQIGILVTFNGASFDLPFIKTCLPHVTLPPGHIDLRWVLKRLGYSGGLKRIESLFGLGRSEDLTDVDGLEAIRLWHSHLRGDKTALDRLVRYNQTDTVNLEKLMDTAYHRLKLDMMGSQGL